MSSAIFTMSEMEAADAADRINAYWRERGLWANARAEFTIVRGIKSWGVRSDTINGRPVAVDRRMTVIPVGAT